MKKILLLLLLSTNCFAVSWECDTGKWGTYTICRASVPHGWLVSKGQGFNSGIAFYPDEKHEWKID